eukprot:COSAG01_NODE_34537_length_546_cov_0.695749_1_plen_39_part_10
MVKCEKPSKYADSTRSEPACDKMNLCGIPRNPACNGKLV